MRERERSRFGTYTWEYRSAPNAPWVKIDPGVTRQFVSRYEYIADRNNGRTRPPSPCTHVKIDVFDAGVRSHTDVYTGATHKISSIDESPHTAPRCARLVLNQLTPLHMDWANSARDAALDAAKITSELSLINNALEFGDIPELISKYTNLGRRISEVNYLDYAFGVAPLVNDIKSLLDNIQNASRRLNQLGKSGVKAGSNSSSAVVGDLDWNGNSYLAFSFNGRHNSAHKVKYTIPGFSQSETQLRLMLDTIGLHVDVGVVWDALPFSWLVDWFLPIGNFLENFYSRGWLQPDVNGSWWATTKVSGDLKVIKPAPPGYIDSGDSRPGNGRGTAFARSGGKVGLDSFYLPEFKMPRLDLQRSAILASLAAAKR